MSDDSENIRTVRGAPLRREATPVAADHQPRKAEKEEEIDMPGASLEAVRRAFFKPFKRRGDEPK